MKRIVHPNVAISKPPNIPATSYEKGFPLRLHQIIKRSGHFINPCDCGDSGYPVCFPVVFAGTVPPGQRHFPFW